MLQILRNKAQSIVIQAIVVIIALVFIFWGVGPNLMNSRDSAIVVNDIEISFQQYQSAYDRAYNNMEQQFGGNIPQSLVENLGIKDQVVNQLIREALLRQGAAEMGIHVSREEVRDTIESMPQFQENETFSMERYDALLAANRYTPQKFEELIQTDILAQKVRLNISNFATTATEYEINNLYRMEKSTVAINYVGINPEEYRDTVTIDRQKVKEWYTTVQDNYTTEPQVKLSYLDFSYANVGEKITIDEAAVQQYYQDNTDLYTQKEQRTVRHILFKVDENSSAEVHRRQRQKAEEILAMARGGSNFAELAREYSEGPSRSQGGALGTVTKGQMIKAFEEAAFNLEEGAISDVVKTSFGYHIIQVEDVSPASTKPLDEVRGSVRTALQTEEAKPLSFQMANAAYEGIISAGSLQAYLDAHPEAEVKTTDFFSRSNPPEGSGFDKKFLETAFTLKEKELSSLIETSNGYAILFAEDVIPPKVPPFSEVKEQVIADYTSYQAGELATETARALLQKAKKTQNLEKSARAAGFTVQSSDYLSKDAQEETNLPADLVQSAFELSTNTRYPDDILAANATIYVYEFVDRKIPQAAPDKEQAARYENAIMQRKQQQILSSWLENKRRQAEIFRHKRL